MSFHLHRKTLAMNPPTFPDAGDRAAALRMALLLAWGCLLAGCGGEPSTPATDNPPASEQRGEATAEEVAREARGSLRCPASSSMPQRAANAPVDDVVGVRPGMSYQDAVNTVLCSHELLVVTPERSRHFNIQTYDVDLRPGFNATFAKPRVQRTGQQIMQEMQDNAMARATNRVVRDVLPGEAKWYVTTVGLPEQEIVIAAAREEWFEESARPTAASLQQALVEKYGLPTAATRGGNELRWAYDLDGALITSESRLFSRCLGIADPDAGTNHRTDCGLVVAASLSPLRSNPALVEFMQVGVIDHAGGYQAITATGRALEEMEMQRRAQEAEDAASKAKKPTL